MAEIPMGSQLYYGRGLNSDTGVVFGTAIEFDDPQLAQSDGQRVVFVLESVTSSRELRETLHIAASASFKLGWGVSAEFSLSSSTEVNSYYTYALIRCNVINPPLTIRNPRLTKLAEELLVQQGWDGFAEAYGWEYVDGLITGGSYYALLEIQTNNETEQRDVKGKLNAYFGPFSASVEFQKELHAIEKRNAINVSVTRSGGTGAVVNTALDEMLNEARTFPQTVKEHPVPIVVLTADYRRNVPLPSVPPPNSLARQQQRDTLNDLGRAYLRLRDYKADLEFVLARPLSDFDEFRDRDPAEVTTAREAFRTSLREVSDEIDEIVRRGTNCASDFGQCQTYTPDRQLLELPTIGGEMANLRELEERLDSIHNELRSNGLIGGGNAILAGDLLVRGQVVAGSNGDNRVLTRHVHGKQAGTDGPAALHLNWDTGQPVHVGSGGAPADLDVHGKVHVDGDLEIGPDKTISSPGRLHIAGGDRLDLNNKAGVMVGRGWGGNGELITEGNLGSAGMSPTQGLPPGWAGGVHTWDVFAEGTIGAGHSGQPAKAGLVSDGVVFGTSKKFVIDHPLRPDEATLAHASIEGPEVAVFYRGEGALVDGCACVELPDYFEALTRPEGRTVLVTPIFTDAETAMPLTVSPVKDRKFFVRTADGSPRAQRFFWEVKAVRADVAPLEVESPKPGPESPAP